MSANGAAVVVGDNVGAIRLDDLAHLVLELNVAVAVAVALEDLALNCEAPRPCRYMPR